MNTEGSTSKITLYQNGLLVEKRVNKKMSCVSDLIILMLRIFTACFFTSSSKCNF